jgi:hypothetical protein
MFFFLNQGPEIIRKNNFIINTGDNMTLEQRKVRIEQNKEKYFFLIRYGLNTTYIKSLKIPRLLSHSICHHLSIKQILDENNNFSIVEKINQMKNLIKCMRNKIYIIENVDRKRKTLKNIKLSESSYTLTLKKNNDDTFELIA